MFRFVTLIALAGCGRFGFDDGSDLPRDDAARGDVATDVPTDVVPLGHDEDGDGVRDVDDTCPHLAVAQSDGDGDGVGDACDPNPALGGDAIALFATMSPGDQPFTIRPFTDGTFTQLPDALRFDGDVGGDNNLYGGLDLAMPLGSVRIALGVDILQVIENTAFMQKQFAMGVVTAPPLYFTELNEIDGQFDSVLITYFDGTSYSQASVVDLANNIHTGALFFQGTYRAGAGVRLDVSWPGEPYVAEVMDAVYQGGTGIEINTNNLHLEIRYLIVISSP